MVIFCDFSVGYNATAVGDIFDISVFNEKEYDIKMFGFIKRSVFCMM